MSALFRQEALARGADDSMVRGPGQWGGFRATLLLLICAAAALIGVLSFGTHARRVSLPGVLVPAQGVVPLVAAQPGVLVEHHAQPGQVVRRGDVLLVVRPSLGGLPSGAQSAVTRSLEDRRFSLERAARANEDLVASRSNALERRLRALTAERVQLDAELDAHDARLQLARESLSRQQALLVQQFISPAQLQARQEEVLAIEARGPALRRQRAALDREQAELEGERQSLPLLGEQARGELQRSLALLAREAAEQPPERQVVVRAPHEGVVGEVHVLPGQSVQEGSPLVTLLPPDAPLTLELFAPTSAIGLIKPGHEVRVRHEAFPYQRFGQQAATVTSVARIPLSPAEVRSLPLAPSWQTMEPVFRIGARLDTSGSVMPGPLLAGMRVQGDVMLERRRWIEWLLAPALGVAARW